MASSAIASMLDELMGRNRNLMPNEKPKDVHWSDPDNCKFFLVEFCPHDLFTNTKADLGPCGKVHDEAMKRMYEEDRNDSYRKTQCQDEFLRFSQRMLTELQTRIRKAKERLLLTQNPDALPASVSPEDADKLRGLTAKIDKLVEEAEEAGCQGNVDEAQKLLVECEGARSERDALRRSVAPALYKGHDFASQQQQKAMEVCDICGAFLIVGDAQQRIDDHLMGKQHIGYARLRAAVDRVLELKKRQREEREKEMEERRKVRDSEDRERDRGGGGSKREARGGSSGRSSRKRSRSRSPGGDRDRRRSRSRDRSRRKRSRSRSRDRRRRRSRSRSRSRDRHRRRRSRSREAKGRGSRD